jgi:transketolase
VDPAAVADPAVSLPALTVPVRDPVLLRALATRGRRHVLEAVARAGAGHVGGPLSCMDILVTLYFHTLRLDPARPEAPDRDRFILSKGHAAIALYAVLAMRGFFPESWLTSFDALGSPLQGHPDCTRCPGVEISTGSLGQGLSVGLGMALGAERRGLDFRVFVLLGDGECQEGQVWECAHVAARYRVRRLRAIVDWNGLPQFGWPGSSPMAVERLELAERFAAFGWEVAEVDGHDPEALVATLGREPSGAAPLAILARTHKGRGVSFMEDQASWHARVPTADELARAREELAAGAGLPAPGPTRPPQGGGRRPTAVSVRSRSPAPGAGCGARPLGAAVRPGASLPPDAAQRVVFGHTLVEMLAADPRIVVLDGDLANSTRADIVAAARPDAFLQMGIAEQNLIGVAAGLATLGMRPWISTFAVFAVKRALDQVRMVVAQTGLPVRIAGAYSGLLTGFTGKTHQSVEDLAVMRAMPGMTVLAPADAYECVAAMRWAAAHPGPVYLRLARDPAPPVFPAPPRDYDPARATWLRRGRHLTLVGTGLQSARNLAAAELLAGAGVEASVLHLPAVKPFDRQALLAAAEPGLVVTVEEHSILGGLGSLVAETLSEARPTRVVRLGIPDVFGESGPNAELLDTFGLSPQRVAARVLRLLRGASDPPSPLPPLGRHIPSGEA